MITSPISWGRRRTTLGELPGLRLGQISPGPLGVGPVRDGIAELKSRTIPILVYTINDSSHGGLADQLAELGVDGLFTDDPLAMRSHMG